MASEPEKNGTDRSGMLGRAWRGLSTPSARWSVLALVVVGLLIGAGGVVGTQVMVGDINGDKLPDIVVGNKRGTFAFIHGVKTVTKDEWEAAQPKPTK